MFTLVLMKKDKVDFSGNYLESFVVRDKGEYFL